MLVLRGMGRMGVKLSHVPYAYGRTNGTLQRPSAGAEVDERAVVDASAVVERGAVVGPYAVVGKDAVVGEGSEVCAHAVVGARTVMGAQCVVHPFAVVGGIPQDKKYGGEETFTRIGDRCVVREHATVHAGTVGGSGRGETVLGDDVLVMTSAHVGHDCVVGNGVVLASSATLAGHVVVGDRSIVGGLAAVHQHVVLGRSVMVGGLAAIRGHVVPFGLAKGNDANLRGLNLIGLRRAGMDNASIRALQNDAYDSLFSQPNTPVASAGNLLARAEALLDHESGLVREVAEFVVKHGTDHVGFVLPSQTQAHDPTNDPTNGPTNGPTNDHIHD